MSYSIGIWDPYAYARPLDYIPTDLEGAENIRWQLLGWNEDEHLTDPRPMLPENPKFLAFAQDLQQTLEQERFSEQLRATYKDVVAEVQRTAKNHCNHLFELPTPLYYSQSEYLLALYEVISRHRLVMFDQNTWVVMLPNGETIPAVVREQIPQLASHLRRLDQDDWLQLDKLPRRIKKLVEWFEPRADHYMAEQGYQVDLSASNAGLLDEYQRYSRFYRMETALISSQFYVGLEGSDGHYDLNSCFFISVPMVDAYFQQIEPDKHRWNLRLIKLKMKAENVRDATSASQVDGYLALNAPIFRLLEGVTSAEQLLALWRTPFPCDPDSNPHADDNAKFYGSERVTDMAFKALILIRMINKPAQYQALMDDIYESTLAKEWTSSAKKMQFQQSWATLTKLLDRDYPPSAD